MKMFSSMRTFLLMLLAMLQFIAPLVHAHAGQSTSGKGLHLPGLERYQATDAVASPAAQLLSAHSGDFIFSVDQGIRPSRLTIAMGAPSDCCLSQISRNFENAEPEPSFAIRYPPQFNRVISLFSVAALSPRAPPRNMPNRSIYGLPALI